MTDHLTRVIHANYDRLATQYAVNLFDELRHKPFDREVLTRFADQTRTRGRVCDIGCGPGHVTRFLHDLGVSVFGVDLSPAMLTEARRRSPGLEFREGNMLALDLAPNSLAGIVAFYAIVNLPQQRLATVFGQMWSVLEANGLLLIAFHVGDEIVRPNELWGVPVTMDFYLHSPEKVCRSLAAAGFALEDVTEREPYPEVEHQTRRAYISARKLQSTLIRRGGQADLEGVRACLSDAFAPFKSAYTPAAYADTVPDFEKLQRRLQTMVVFVAELPGRIVGTVGVSTSHTSEAHLRGMAVVPSAQGKGIAQQLLSAALDHCKSAGCTRVTLDTTAPLRAAIRFYEKNGFRATGRIADFFGMELFEYELSLDDGEIRE